MTRINLTRFGGSSAIALAAALMSVGLAAPAVAQETTAAEPTEAQTAAQPVPGIPEWGITDAQIVPDPTVTYGVLDNGMRYALKRNAQPAGEASIRFQFNVGTRDERDNEEGAAHFVEHMAFNGSTNIPEGELVPMLERLGLAFGADTNAETWPDRTIYKLDLPKLDDETLDASFKILREMASELTIAPEAVEAEKGIVLSEFQVRNSADRRRAVQFLGDVMADSRLADRSVAEPEATSALTADVLREFYRGYYRPEKATLVIVGDFDVAEMEQRITETFASWEGKGEARAEFQPEIAAFDDTKVSVFVDPAARGAIELHRVKDYAQTTNSVAEFRGELLDLAAVIAMGSRLSSLSRAEDAKFLGGGIGAQELFKSAELYLMNVLAKDGEWRATVQLAEQEWRRMAEFGITNAELKQAKDAMESSFVTAVAQSNSSTNAGIAGALATSSLENSVRQSPEQRLALYRALADTITPEAVKENFAAKWGTKPDYVQVGSKTPIEGGAQAVAAALSESTQVALTAPEEAADIVFAYTDFGPAGEVVSDTRIDDLGIRTVEFANGVRLNLKKTGFEPGKVLVRAEFGTGIAAVEDKPGIELIAVIVNGGDDLGKHSAEDLSRLMSGKQAGYGYQLGQNSVFMSNTTTAEDLLFQLQVMAAQATDTAFSAQSQRRWEAAAPLIANNLVSNPQFAHGAQMEAIIANGDTRLGFGDPSVLSELSMDDLKAVVGGQFASGQIDIGIVGDVDEDAAIAAVARTLGAIERAESAEQTIKPITLTNDRSVRTVYHQGEADQGYISLSWPTDDGSDLRSELTRLMLAEVINLEALRVLREELAATYTPSTQSTASAVYDGYGHISLIMPATPASMDEVSKVVREIVAGFTKEAPSADAMQRARQPVLEGYERDDGRNGGWIGVVTTAQSHPAWLEDRRNRSEVLKSITPEDVMAAAKQYLAAEPIEVRAVPKPTVDAAE